MSQENTQSADGGFQFTEISGESLTIHLETENQVGPIRDPHSMEITPSSSHKKDSAIIDEELRRQDQSLEKSIDMIEKEIRQIDHIVKSWSDDRTLRFDPSHVKPAKELLEDHQRKSDRAVMQSKRFFQVVSLFNILAILLIAGLAGVQMFFQVLTSQRAFEVLVASGLSIAALNFLLVRYGKSKTSPYWGASKKPNRLSKSRVKRGGRETA